ncbi:MAG: hypothetical protein WB560_12890 [Desulfobaccales bacterium]
MLYDHLLHGGVRQVGVESLAAELAEVIKGLDKALVGAVLLTDQGQERGGVLRQLIFELIDRSLPFLKMGRLIGEEGLEDFN